MEPIIVMAILVIAIVGICTNKIPLGVIGLFMLVALAATGVLTPAEAFKRFNETSIILIAACFVFAAAFFDTGCADIIGRGIHRLCGRSKNKGRLLVFAIALMMIICSSVLPNTALTAAMIPVVLAVAKASGVSRTHLLLTTALFANLGGSVSLLGSPCNLVGRAALESAELGTLTFFDFTLIGLPIALLCLVFYMLTYKKLIPERYIETEIVEDTTYVKTKLTKKQWGCFILFGIFVLSVILEAFCKTIPGYVVGMACCAALVLFRIIKEKTAMDGLDITTWLFIIGALTLSDAFLKSGASDIITNFVVGILGEKPNEIILITVLYFIGVIMTQFLTNTGSAGILCPIAIALAVGLGADARAAVVAIVIACNSSFATPMATPANLIVSAPGHLKFGDWTKIGLPMIVISYICCIVILPLIFPMYPVA